MGITLPAHDQAPVSSPGSFGCLLHQQNSAKMRLNSDSMCKLYTLKIQAIILIRITTNTICAKTKLKFKR